MPPTPAISLYSRGTAYLTLAERPYLASHRPGRSPAKAGREYNVPLPGDVPSAAARCRRAAARRGRRGEGRGGEGRPEDELGKRLGWPSKSKYRRIAALPSHTAQSRDHRPLRLSRNTRLYLYHIPLMSICRRAERSHRVRDRPPTPPRTFSSLPVFPHSDGRCRRRSLILSPANCRGRGHPSDPSIYIRRCSISGASRRPPFNFCLHEIHEVGCS